MGKRAGTRNAGPQALSVSRKESIHGNTNTPQAPLYGGKWSDYGKGEIALQNHLHQQGFKADGFDSPVRMAQNSNVEIRVELINENTFEVSARVPKFAKSGKRTSDVRDDFNGEIRFNSKNVKEKLNNELKLAEKIFGGINVTAQNQKEMYKLIHSRYKEI